MVRLTATPPRGAIARIRAAHAAKDAKALAGLVRRIARIYRRALREMHAAEQVRRDTTLGFVADVEVWARSIGEEWLSSAQLFTRSEAAALVSLARTQQLSGRARRAQLVGAVLAAAVTALSEVTHG